VAGITFIMGIPGADDIMLNYQSTSYHDSLYVRRALSLRRAPEFEEWLERMQMTDAAGRLRRIPSGQPLLRHANTLSEAA
jgi:ethanolamine ammonia-lyase large subunit